MEEPEEWARLLACMSMKWLWGLEETTRVLHCKAVIPAGIAPVKSMGCLFWGGRRGLMIDADRAWGCKAGGTLLVAVSQPHPNPLEANSTSVWDLLHHRVRQPAAKMCLWVSCME